MRNIELLVRYKFDPEYMFISIQKCLLHNLAYFVIFSTNSHILGLRTVIRILFHRLNEKTFFVFYKLIVQQKIANT